MSGASSAVLARLTCISRLANAVRAELHLSGRSTRPHKMPVADSPTQTLRHPGVDSARAFGDAGSRAPDVTLRLIQTGVADQCHDSLTLRFRKYAIEE